MQRAPRQLPGWWLVDGSLLARRILHAKPNSFISSFCQRAHNFRLISESVNARTVFVFDNDPSSQESDTSTRCWRHEFLPGCKTRSAADRLGSRSLQGKYVEGMELLQRRFFPAAGIPFLRAPRGVEADDALAELADREIAKNRHVTLLSTDKDLFQLLRAWPHLEVLDPFSLDFVTPHCVKDKYGVFPHRLAEFFAINGDRSDRIPGVSSVGPKRIATLFDPKSIPLELPLNEVLARGYVLKSNLPKKFADILVADTAKIERNYALTVLPSPRRSAENGVGISSDLVRQLDAIDLLELACETEQKRNEELREFAGRHAFKLHPDIESLYRAGKQWRRLLFRQFGQQYTGTPSSQHTRMQTDDGQKKSRRQLADFSVT
ncbi:unnamed protein product [Amoebophrya sp. A25]|nr:unnamed protein product [Amoebophrya sp. A25]|eukprot:GSA25T00005690001.1